MNSRYEQSSDKYTGLKKLLAIVAAAGLWGVSMYFSYKGFEFESTNILWFGLVLALVVTVVELVFNTKIRQLNPTLLVAGVICYVYGIYTNITGFYFLQHGELVGFFTGTNWLIPSFAGVIAEVLPEALFAWGLGAGNNGDFIGNLGEMLDNKKQNERTQNTNNTSNNFRNSSNREYEESNLFSQSSPTNVQPDPRFGKNSGKSPSSLKERIERNQRRN